MERKQQRQQDGGDGGGGAAADHVMTASSEEEGRLLALCEPDLAAPDHHPRNKRRAGEFDPHLLSRLASLTTAAATVAPPVGTQDAAEGLPPPAVASGGAGGGGGDDDEWLAFPVVPTHAPNWEGVSTFPPPAPSAVSASSPLPGGLHASASASMTTTTTTTTTTMGSAVSSSSSPSVPTTAGRGRSARRYSIAVGSTALRDHLGGGGGGPRPAPQLASAASAAVVRWPPSSGGTTTNAMVGTAPPHRGRAPTGPLPLLPTPALTATADLRKERNNKGEADYQKLRELALKEDFDDLEKRQALYKAGRDKLGRQVVVFTLYNLGEKVDFERLLLYIIKVMDKLVEEEYALVFCQTHMTTAHRPPFTWLRKAYGMFQRKYKKNLKAAYIIHASTLVRMTLKLFKPFISSKFWKKLVYIDQVTDIYQYIRPDQLTLPDEVLTFNRESRATPLFGLPLAAGCARNPTTSLLPIVCERAFEVLDTRGVELEGIFRVSGSTALLNELKQRFDRGEDVDLGFAEVHTVAGLLKLYLRELPEPLMTFRLYEPFITAVRRSREWTDIGDEVAALVRELPTENYILSARLYTLLGRVAENADKNLMNVNNLAIVVGPNVRDASTPRRARRSPDRGRRGSQYAGQTPRPALPHALPT
ncbi:RhoGAP domain containing protein [Acanthamoeba castellanii str. Neff]|uniref:RhoGAP domain containing protein n=1 Tax=Acanthamoeba castellanii (strain ATCC 30010 / Neff) TaxID=1257118 RepID=L8H3D6_ACACF|nr:RhoGAP domain containing protein [Acanthamoeba castellanii str. Neff]ELR18936.1 RhoGAP domain containing protein [Acanthamoeba castellanii str. Neff]